MCGLWGAFSAPGLSDSEIDNALLLGYLSGIRGNNSMDSTGLYVLGKNDKNEWTYRIAKEVLPSPIFVMDSEIKKEWHRKDIRLMMGHSRAATIGEITKEFTQPFIDGDIVLAHNGTIESFVKNKHNPKESDSKEFARRLNENKKDVERVLWQADAGHYAISLLNYHDYSLTLVRNASRSLFLMPNENSTTIYWASEPWMLRAMADRTSLKMGAMMYPDSHILYKWSLSSMKMEEIKMSRLAPKQESKGKLFQTPMFCKDCRKRTEYCTCRQALPMLPAPGKKKETSVPDTSKWVYQGFRAVRYTKSNRKPVLKAGCASCKTPVYDLRDKVYWFAPNHFFCEDCHENNPVVKAQILDKKFSTYEGRIVKA